MLIPKISLFALGNKKHEYIGSVQYFKGIMPSGFSKAPFCSTEAFCLNAAKKCTGCPNKKFKRLMDHRTKGFCSINKFSFYFNTPT